MYKEGKIVKLAEYRYLLHKNSWLLLCNLFHVKNKKTPINPNN